MTISEATAPASTSAEQLTALLKAFRLMQLQHGRVIIHQSTALAMGATDIRALFFISEAGDGVTPKQVAEFLELSTGATTSLVDRLEAGGTIERTAHPTDRRSVVLALTPAGRGAVQTVADVYRCALAQAIPESDYAEMTTLFGRVAVALSEGSDCFDQSTA
ncbi:DNA-binding MarR family transcriptional regulator [Frondihabitans sp. PhB188]|uniref:MarR family winged helix-turn-helix transcriptional regulator n=1 Tax=Frondihabitans sp. PhB188 TaxID=2485200 RepID=UPI000F4907D0|nr:MarR family transcriptional regulator [Frondihabitans sp. PhB188]ROQ39876.1 DNA-binding MarR family transcriptional regulator [Frondihabitans sp. PhB188]